MAGKKMGDTGNKGQLAGKTGKSVPPAKAIGLQKIDHKSIGSAMGILKKHHK